MNHHLALTRCPKPPVAGCQPGEWWRYEVATESGKGQACGYAPGTELEARRVAIAALHSLQRAECVPLTRFGDQSIPALKKRSGHDMATCNCRLCANRRYKKRTFDSSLVASK